VIRAFALARACFVRDLLVDTSYKVSVALDLIDVLIGVAAFYYLSRVLGNQRPAGYDAFGFILIGVAANSAMNTALACFGQTVKMDQQAGTLKPILVTPVSPGMMVACSSVYPLVRSVASGCAYLAAGAVIFEPSWRPASPFAAAAVLAAAIGAFAAVGLLSAAFTLVVKRGDPFLWLFGALSWLLGGVFFPVETLPLPLQRAAHLLPITYALDGLRATLLGGAGISAVARPLTVLSAMAVVGLPISIWLVCVATAWGKRRGTLGHY